MNNYHLYEEIGHGKFSIVYKGRKRHTIRYLAIKSVEKGRREKVMTEVTVMSLLVHGNVVGYVNFYETRNHLWVISEYCAGGDLLHLLKQDGRLPESQVRQFGRDLCAGLLHVQSRGVVYSDMKPANVLISEDGVLKLSNFGHAQRLEDIARLLQEGSPLPRRGTPHYMAPELFQEGGMHSFASDLWALGCVLHEMLTGRPPFHATSIPEIQETILRDPLRLAADGSPDLQALLASLLQKAPLDRSSWTELRAHPLWEGRPPGDDEDAGSLPEQPQLPLLRQLWGGPPDPAPASNGVAPALHDPSIAESPNRAVAAMSPPSLRQPSAAPTLVAAASPASLARRAVGSPAEEYHEPEPAPEPVPPRGRSPTGAAAIAKALSAAAAAAATVPSSPPPAEATGAAGLRARLGASTHARARELVTVAETSVRPISRNPQIEEPETLEAPGDLPFAPLSLEEVCAQQHADLEAFLARVYKSLSQGHMEQKLSALRYLEQICAHMHVADLVVNSSLLRLVLRMLQAAGGVPAAKAGVAPGYPGNSGAAPASQLPLRIRLLSLLGQLLRHATYLEPGAAELGFFDVLLDGLDDDDSAVRRRSAAALGELLFYIATQPAPAVAAEATASEWRVPTAVLAGLARALTRSNADEVVQHYVAKTIENVATQGPATAQEWFFSAEMIQALAHHARHAPCDPFRLSCLSAVSRLLRDRSEALQFADAAALVAPELVEVGFCQLVPHGVPHSLQLIATLLLSAPSLESVSASLPRDVVQLLMGAVAQPRYSSGLRGRAALLLALLFVMDGVHDARHLCSALDSAFVPNVDRLCREKDRFVVQCVAAVAAVMEVVAQGVLQSLVGSLRQLPSLSKTAASEFGRGLTKLLPALLHLASSSMLCSCVLGARALPLLGNACELGARLPAPLLQQGELQQLQPLLLMVMEALSTQQSLVLEHASQVVRCILPPLANFLKSEQGEVRLLALKCFSGLCTVLVNDSHVFNPEADKPSETTRLLQTLLCRGTLPLLPALLADEPPAPSYAVRLVAAGYAGAPLGVWNTRPQVPMGIPGYWDTPVQPAPVLGMPGALGAQAPALQLQHWPRCANWGSRARCCWPSESSRASRCTRRCWHTACCEAGK